MTRPLRIEFPEALENWGQASLYSRTPKSREPLSRNCTLTPISTRVWFDRGCARSLNRVPIAGEVERGPAIVRSHDAAAERKEGEQ
jgi:hypothetical protein